MKLFCKLPFTRISIDDDGNVWPACCPDWVAFPLGNVFKQTWDDIWLGDAATAFRDSMFDGSLRFCEKNWCPGVSDAQAGIKNFDVIPHERSPRKWVPAPPVHVNLNYDLTCNLRCPSCRHDLIHYRGANLEKVRNLHHYVEENILPYVHSVALTGVGDPFMSRVFRDFLFNFSSSRFPNIKKVHLHTNGLLFDEKAFEKMSGMYGIQLSADISIDAASAETYAKVRPPGDWDTLIQNLAFIKTIPNLKELGISMVVQKDNFHEILPFVALAQTLVTSNRRTFVEFKRPRQYNHLNDQQYAAINPDAMSTVDLEEFRKIILQLETIRWSNNGKPNVPAVKHNLQDYLPSDVVFEKNKGSQILEVLHRMTPDFLRWKS
jgi:molybdenum cofactor biosynthesis enzyme MoaA